MSKITKHPCVGCSNDFVCDICYQGRDWMKNIIIELQDMIPELKKNAGSYTGEYEGGQLDLIHEILGLEPYEWGTDFTVISKEKPTQEGE